MTRAPLAFVAVVAVSLAAGVTAQLLRTDPEHVRPPHAARPTAGVPIGTSPLPLAAVGGESPQPVIDAVTAWVAGVQREQERLAAEETARLEAARAAAERRVAPTGGSAAYGDCAALAAEFGLPAGILERESGCGHDNWNGSGCSGRGCIGPTQIDLGHFADPSPWGAPGACRDLDPNVWADLVECTRRLSSDGSNLAPWGG